MRLKFVTRGWEIQEDRIGNYIKDKLNWIPEHFAPYIDVMMNGTR